MKTTYLTPTNLYQEAQRRLEELYSARQALEKRLKSYPEGKIRVVKKGKKVQYYLRTDPKDRSGVYISKQSERKIESYLQKKYDESAIKQVNFEIKNLEHVLRNSKLKIENLQNLYSDYPQEIKKYIKPLDISDEEYAREWFSIPYKHKAIPEEIPVYLTDNGEQVRSKSELNIANMLFKMQVPYKYECPLILFGGRIIHPDFTLLDTHMRREIYWEHRGMMDDRSYLRDTVQRIKTYRKEGIQLGDNLIITEETSTLPLGTDEILSVIKHFMNK